MINSEVWNNVVSWGSNIRFVSSEIGVEFLAQSCLGLRDSVGSINDISINSEVWDNVVSWSSNTWFVSSEISMKGFLQCFFRVSDGTSNVKDMSIESEIWNWIVNWMRYNLIKVWNGNWNLPCDRSWGWSVLKKYS